MFSNETNVSCGVPKGSILGPLLFLIYVNDMSNVSQLLFTLLFADDTNVFTIGIYVRQLIAVMNNKLTKIVEWLNVNQLSFNVKKAYYMIFNLYQNSIFNDTDIKINGQMVARIACTKFLGDLIDEKLSWADYIQSIKMKISKDTGILNKAKKYINLSTLVTLYHRFLYPYLTYCLEVWEGAGDVYLLSQKRVVRIMRSLPHRAHTEPIFLDLKLLNIYQLYKQKIVLFMFKYIRGCLPKLFNNYYIRNVDIHSHVTRQQNLNFTHINVGRLPHKRPSGVMVLFYGMNFQAKYVLMSALHVIKER